jgi:hypothetical protein
VGVAGQAELRPIPSPAALRLFEGRGYRAAVAGCVPGDRRALGAEAGAALLVGADPVVGDEARAWRCGHGRQDGPWEAAGS